MKKASIKTAIVQMEVHPGHPLQNTDTMLQSIGEARLAGAELVVFPEMSIPGYLIGDEWERDAFIRECEACGERIRAASEGIIVAFGNVGVDRNKRNEDGRVRKYNACFVASNGVFVGPQGGDYPFAIKTLLPNYRMFDDSRHFFDLRKLALETGRSLRELVTPIHTNGISLGCVLCEDAWNMDYAISPLSLLAERNVDLFVNISASPFTLSKNHKRNRVFAAQADELKRPLVYVNHVGVQNNGKTVFTFDGSCCVYDGHGNSAPCGAPFTPDLTIVDIPLDGRPLGAPIALAPDGIAETCAAVSYGTEKFAELCGVSRVVIGISGGIDSAVVAALYRRFLDPENLLLINMPGAYTSQTTRGLARDLADTLECSYAEVPILDSVELTRNQIDGLTISTRSGTKTLQLSDLMLENVQARDRSSRILAAIASAFGGVFTCNANKSEATVGYTTLYGDLGGYLANIADLWKTEVYALARYLNEHVYGQPVIPQGSIDIPPSAELSAAQNVDEGKGDPLIYPYHDLLFKSWVENWERLTPEDILSFYHDGSLADRLGYQGSLDAIFPSPLDFINDLERWWGLYQGMGLAKRIQAPPILAVKRRAFGFDHRESQMGARYTAQYVRLKEQILSSQ